MKSVTALLGSLLLLSLLSAAAYGQTAGTGAIAGVVSDPSGAVVSQATIKVTNNQTGEQRTAVSASGGNYTVPLLPPGTYMVEVSKSGFKTSTYRAVTVNVTETAPLNTQLQVGAISETVEVTGQEEQLQTESSAAGRVTDEKIVESMPLVTRNFTQIIGLSTGVSTDVTNAAELGRGNGSNGNDAFVAAGGAGYDNNFQMNGVEVNDLQEAGNFSGGVAVPNPDAIQEFKVQTGQFDASFGRDAGANVNLVTKTGTNDFHGSVFEFFRNDALNANDWFRNENGEPRQLLRQNQYGMTFGGPLIKNKLLFFTSYQGTRQTNGVDPTCSTTFTTPPLTNDRSAAALGALFYGQPTFIQEITGDPALGPSIAQDGSNIDGPALALLQMKLPNGQYLYPTPQRINTSLPFGSQGSYSVSLPCPFYEEQFMTNADWNQSDKTQWQVRYFFANGSQVNTLPSPNLGGPTAPGFPYEVKQHFRNFSLTNNHTFSNNLLNQAEVGYHRQLSANTQQSAFTYPQIGVTIGGTYDDIPEIETFGLPTLGGSGFNFTIVENTTVVQDTVAWQKGRHSMRFGGGVTRPQDNVEAFQFLAGLIFLTVPDMMLGQAGTPYGLPFGNVYASIDLPLLTQREWRLWDGNAYFQDDYKVTPRLTLNLGLRYERLGNLSDNLGRMSNFDFTRADPNPPAEGSLQGFVVGSDYSGPPLPAGVVKGNRTALAGDAQNAIEPRIGFAWRLPGNDKVVLRGGYGLFREHQPAEVVTQLLTTPPWAAYRLQEGTDPTVTFANPFAFPGVSANLPAFTPYSPTTSLSGTNIAYNFRTGALHRYSLNIQTEIRKDMMLEVGYIGARGLHLSQFMLPNQALDATVTPIRGQTTNTLANLYERVPVEGFGIATWNQIASEGASWYNGLEASLTKRFSHGLQFLASYTWAKQLTTDYGASTGVNGALTIGNQLDPSARWGPDPYIRPQRFVVSYVYEPPFFKNRAPLLRNTLGGWKLAGVTTIQSGHPLAVQNTNTFNIFGIPGDFAQLAPNCTLSQVNTSGSVQSKIDSFINQSCFGTTVAGVYTPTPYPVISADGGTAFGNTRPGIVHGPDQNNTDLSLIKNISVRWPNEKGGIEFRAEMFNAFNHPQFFDPNTTVDSPGFGQITNMAVSPRIMQFALKLSF
jgi:hypothetical protein